GHIHHQGDVEAGLVLHHGPGVLGNFGVEDVVGLVAGGLHRVHGTAADAPAAAHALAVVDAGLFPGDGDGAVGVVLLAGAAADAQVLVHVGLARGVHLHFPCPGAAAHADVLQTP